MNNMDDRELEHLSMIIEKINDEIGELSKTLVHKEKEIINMKKAYWESLTEIHEQGYEAKMSRTDIVIEVNSAEDNLNKLRTFEKMKLSPYFGRIDFIYDGEYEPETYYIGIGNFYPKWSSIPLIFDWRAPVASLFYDYDKGRASYQAPVGKIEGEIVKKLQYKIKNGTMEFYFEHDIKIDDDILMHELAQNANASLKSIVTTIQKEQNEIIRNDRDKILVVQGVAGSGKTSVALHRIAYLLYHKRKDFTSKDILILSPNSVFSDYISHILPELGEENIVEMSFDDFAEKELKGTAKLQSRFENLESLLVMKEGSLRREKRVKREKRKLSAEYVHGLEKYVAHMDEWIVKYKDFNFKNISRTAADIKKLFTKKFYQIPLLKRLEAVAEYIIEEEATLKGEDVDIVVAETIKGKILSMYTTTDLLKIYNKYLLHRGESGITVEDRYLQYEDVYPVLYLKYLLYGRLEYRQIKHLVVDEMQDYSYLQYVLLKKLFPCSMTILGDKEQVADSESSKILEYLPEIFGEEVSVVTLNKSYRSTYEISSFANGLIGQTDIEHIMRQGKPVETMDLNKEDVIVELKKKLREASRWETTAIVCKSNMDAMSVYESLKDSVNVSIITEETDRFIKGIVIVPFYLAKGLEFDTVHIPYVRKEDFSSSFNLQVLYIASTRALHELYIYQI